MRNPSDLWPLVDSAPDGLVPILLVDDNLYASADFSRGHKALRLEALRRGHVAPEPFAGACPASTAPLTILAVAHRLGVCLDVDGAMEHPMFHDPENWTPSGEFLEQMESVIARAMENRAFSAAVCRWNPDICVEVSCNRTRYAWLYECGDIYGREILDADEPRRSRIPPRKIQLTPAFQRL